MTPKPLRMCDADMAFMQATARAINRPKPPVPKAEPDRSAVAAFERGDHSLLNKDWTDILQRVWDECRAAPAPDCISVNPRFIKDLKEANPANFYQVYGGDIPVTGIQDADSNRSSTKSAALRANYTVAVDRTARFTPQEWALAKLDAERLSVRPYQVGIGANTPAPPPLDNTIPIGGRRTGRTFMRMPTEHEITDLVRFKGGDPYHWKQREDAYFELRNRYTPKTGAPL